VINIPEMVPDADGKGLTLARAKESFSEITLKGSELKAVPALLGSIEKKPEFTRELYQVRWRPNDPIDLYVIRPVGVKNPPVAIYLYGFPSETSRFKDDSWCQRTTHGGVAVIGFVSAFTGHRGELKPAAENFITKMPEAIASTTHDLQMVLDALATRNDLDLSRVGVFGQGSGATIAILAAAADPRIKSIDLLDPWGDWPVWLASAQDVPSSVRPTLLKPEFEKALEPLEPLHYLPELKSRKIRIQFQGDQGEPREVVDKLKAAAPSNAEVILFANSQGMYRANAGGRLFEWLDNSLGAHPAPAPTTSNAKAVAVPPASSKP
jgi:pimeloyl-ACP methyl ester carboxylesterase